MASVSSQLAYMPLAEVAVLLKKRELSPVELTQATLDRISTLDSKIHAYYTVFADKVLTEAREAEAQIRAGNYRGPLHGIPVAVKDIWGLYGRQKKSFMASTAFQVAIVVLVFTLASSKAVQDKVKAFVPLIAPIDLAPPPVAPPKKQMMGGGGMPGMPPIPGMALKIACTIAETTLNKNQARPKTIDCIE